MDYPNGRGHDVEQYFDHWQENFYNHEDIEVFVDDDWSYFCQFVNDDGFKRNGDYIKLYIPLDLNHLYQGANIIFDYLEKLGSPHNSKIGKHIRSDNVVIRLNGDDYETAEKMIDFINNNEYLKKGLNSTNPFISNIRGIGYMKESGISYNSEIANLLGIYVKQAITEKKEVSLVDFKNWIYQNAPKYSPSVSEEVIETFNISIKPENKVVIPENNLEPFQKVALLNDTISATYQKYGAIQVIEALDKAINKTNYGYFTNGDNQSISYRDKLIKNVSSDEIKSHVLNTASALAGQPIEKIESAIIIYIHTLLQNEMVSDLEKICSVTLEKYNVFQVFSALKEFYLKGKTDKFTRFPANGDKTVNYREKISHFNASTLMSTIQTSLILKGLPVENIVEFTPGQTIKMYCESLEKSMYKDDLKTQKKY